MFTPFRRLRHICLSAVMLLLAVAGTNSSCSGRGDAVAIEGDTVSLSHSSLLSIVDCDGYTVVDVKNPWSNGLLNRYILLPRDKEQPQGIPEGEVLEVPLQNVVLFSGVHAGLLEELGAISAVRGVCDAQYNYNSYIRNGLSSGTVTDCGSSLDADVERIIDTAPEALFVLPFENGGYGKIDKLGMPVVECADYMETSPLGCAEWIRFYGRLFGCETVADSLFSKICSDYSALKELASSVEARPKLMCELWYGSAWYVPAGESTTGQIYSDAGADYLFSSYRGSGSVPLAFETVLSMAASADIWLFKYNSPVDKSKDVMLAEYPGYAHFKPFKEGNMFACNTSKKRIFEETAFHPERLLRELVAIFHSGLLPQYKPVYYEKVCQ